VATEKMGINKGNGDWMIFLTMTMMLIYQMNWGDNLRDQITTAQMSSPILLKKMT